MIKNKAPLLVWFGQTKIRTEIQHRNRKILWLSMLLYFVLLTTGCTSTAQQECSWPCFHGADRTNKSTETGLMKKWPEAGPELFRS